MKKYLYKRAPYSDIKSRERLMDYFNIWIPIN